MGELKNILLNIGAIAGVASIVGLAVLVLLYFSQARDVRRLREWAGREPERAAEVELRAAQIASQAIAQAYESMAMRQSEADAAAEIAREQGVDVGDIMIAAEPPAPPPPDATEEHPEPVVSGMEGAADDPEHLLDLAAEAGVSAQSEGTQEHPEPVVSGMEGAADDPEHLLDLAAAAGGNGQVSDESAIASPAGEETSVLPAAYVPTVSASAEPAPTVAAEAGAERAESIAPPPAAQVSAGATGEVRPSRLAPSTPAAARGQIPLPPLPPLDTSEFLAVNRPLPSVPPDYYAAAESAGTGGFESGGRAPEPRGSRVPMIVAGLLVLVFAGVLIATLVGGGGTPTKSETTARRQARDQRTISTSQHSPRINRPAVNVSVLNGTQTSGLAKIVGDQLISAGFTSTTTGNRNDGIDHPTSTVYYAPGSKLEAAEVARELKIKDVRQIDSGTATVAGSAPVVVVLGEDINQ